MCAEARAHEDQARTSTSWLLELFLSPEERKEKVLDAQSCPTFWDPMDCGPPGFSVHGILQARILAWIVIPFSKDLPNPGVEPWSPALQAGSLPFGLVWGGGPLTNLCVGSVLGVGGLREVAGGAGGGGHSTVPSQPLLWAL